MKKNQIYKGFKVLDIKEIKECSSLGIYLRHEKSGLEVFHLLNDDEENTFAFAFRTPVKNNTGLPHVLEHSVLCGSKKYPISDPFLCLANQSVNTYLNAYTASDRTVFPASSPLKADYYNLMSVYADAVFFPLLKKEIFLQECHRLDYDENNKLTIQGVVYNEMKGVYSNFDSIASDAMDSVLTAGTNYEYDSGGNPLFIPDLSYEDFLAYHKKYYCLSNCLVFLHGNIPTEEQLEFLNDNVISKISDFGNKAYFSRNIKPVKSKLKAYGPSAQENEDNKNLVSLVWRNSDFIKEEDISNLSMELLFLSELLMGDDCAPLCKKILDKKICDNIAYQTGADLSSEIYSIAFALRGVKKNKINKTKKIVMNALQEILSEGISQDDFDRVYMFFDFNNREIKRFNGPFSLVYLRRILKSWTYGFSPFLALPLNENFEALKSKIENDKDFVSSLIKKHLLENKNVSHVSVFPSKKWSLKRIKQEEKIIKKQVNKLGLEQIQNDLNLLKSFQKNVPLENNDCIPRLKIDDLDEKIPLSIIKKQKLKESFILTTNQETNGILYFNQLFPIDNLKPEDIKYISIISECFAEVGWGNVNWVDASNKLKKVFGGINCSPSISAFCNLSNDLLIKDENLDRSWLNFSFKVPKENLKEAFDVFYECLFNTNFGDLNRLSDNIKSYYNTILSYVSRSPLSVARLRAKCDLSKETAMTEILYGITSLFELEKFKQMDISLLSENLQRVYNQVLSSGSIIHLTGDSELIAQAKKILSSKASEIKFKCPDKRKKIKDSEYIKLTELGEKSKIRNPKIDEVFIIPGTVGYACSGFEVSDYSSTNYVIDDVLSHCLETTDLWYKIRTEGGAYGVYLSNYAKSKISLFSTYRDPSPFNSLEFFDDFRKTLSNKEFSQDMLEKSITGLYSNLIEPQTPFMKGQFSLLSYLHGFTNSIRVKYLKTLLKTRLKDIKLGLQRYSTSKKRGKTVVFCPKEMILDKIIKKTGKIVELPV